MTEDRRMEVKIGVQHAPRELIVETKASMEELEKEIHTSLGQPDGVLALTDTKGRRFLVPASKVSYVEIGTGVIGQVGFRT